MRIGFVDDALDNFHADVFYRIISDDLKPRGFAVAGCFASDAAGGRKWAEGKGVPFFERVEQLNEVVDCYMILAPSNPELHLDLCRLVFPFGKPTYVDKTFAPDIATAKQIFELADQHRVPVQTASALRYTEIQKYVESVERGNVRHMVAWGAGRSFGEYAIHPVELVVSCMGPDVVSLMRRGDGKESQLLINFKGDRNAVVNVYCDSATDFAAAVTTAKGTVYLKVDPQRLFVDAAAGILDFLGAGEPLIDRAETLAIRAILDTAERAAARHEFTAIE